MRILWAVRAGAPAWREEVITTHADRIDAARAWAEANGFDRFRVADMPDTAEAPDFTATIKM